MSNYNAGNPPILDPHIAWLGLTLEHEVYKLNEVVEELELLREDKRAHEIALRAFQSKIDNKPNCVQKKLTGKRGYAADSHDGSLGKAKTIVYPNGDKYTGPVAVVGDKWHGYGILTYADGTQYIGEIANDMPHGKGIRNFANGGRYEGMFDRGEPAGRGEYTYPDGSKYIGSFVKGKKHGQGIIIKPEEGILFSGTFANDMRNGLGKYIYADGSSYECMYRDDLQYGEGKYIYKDGPCRKSSFAKIKTNRTLELMAHL